jgi:glutamate decarboxylase
LEKQVIAKIHRLIYEKDEAFYEKHVQNIQTTLGCFIEDGTLANLTAFWVARNSMLAPKNGFAGVEQEGLQAAYKAYQIERCVILVSKLGHYCVKKAGGLLGIGNQNIITIDVNADNRMDLDSLKKAIKDIKNSSLKTKIIAIVGIAGATETGTVDPLSEINSFICRWAAA